MHLQHPEPEDLLCDESFQRYCLGDNQQDTLVWEQWIAANPELLPVVNSAKRLFNILAAGQGSRLEQLAALEDAMARRDQMQQLLFGKADIPPQDTARIIRWNATIWMKYAAAIVVLLSIGILMYVSYSRKSVLLNSYDYTTAGHERRTIFLPDSSVIMLNGNSHLAISKNFSASHREVTISGEAFFDVKTDASHPFVVHTNDYQIRVLGTSFNVKGYPGTPVETGLLSGKIEIRSGADKNPGNRILLEPNEKFMGWQNAAIAGTTMPSVKKLLQKIHIDSITQQAVETSWMRRKLEINNETFETFAKKLEEWYGIKIVIVDAAVKQYRYTATFNDESVFKVLHYLQQSYPFSYKVEDNSIIVTQN